MNNKLLFNIRHTTIAFLLFIWAIPHTITVRYSLAILLILTCIPIFKDVYSSRIVIPQSVRTAWILLTTLSLWIVTNAYFISPEPIWALNEIRGQWDTALIFALIGTALGLNHYEGESILKAIIFVLILITAFYVIDALVDWKSSGKLITRRPGMHGSPYEQSIISATLTAFLASDLYARIIHRQNGILKIPLFSLLSLIGISSFATYLTRIRLGVIGVVALLLSSALIFYIRKRSISVILTSILLAMTAISLLAFHIVDDARWGRLVSTVELATDQDNDAWKGSPGEHQLPMSTNNQRVDESNYLRMAYAYNGLKIIGEHPLGVGFGRNAFGHQVARDNPELEIQDRGFHSHSGIIDFTIGVGIPGLILWLLLLAQFLRISITYGFKKRFDPLAIALMLLITSGLYRSIVDSTLRDHYLQFSMFIYFFIATQVETNLGNHKNISPNPKLAPPPSTP